jgi:choline dehydrogenase-like flavoprotein
MRRRVMQLRLIYLRAIYSSPLGLAIAGLTPSAAPAAHEGIEPPRFPPTWLMCDSLNREIRARDGSIDDIIVGSGPAGSVLASELRRSGRRVLLLEQGSFVLPGAMATRAHSRLLENGGNRASVTGSVLFNNAETVGGGTAVNIDLVFSPTHRSVQHQLDRWRAQGRIAPTQFSMSALESADRWVKGMLGTRTPADSEINRNNRALWDGAQRTGLHPHLYELNTYAPGQWPTRFTDKRSSVSALLLPAMLEKDDPLALVPDAQVTRVIVDGKAVRGVQLVVREPWSSSAVLQDPMKLHLHAGDTLTIEARRVILCAGALGSATILLRSGISNPAIGRGIVAHIAVPVIGMFDQRIDATSGTPATVFVDDYAVSRRFILEAMSAGPEYAAVMVPGTGRHVFDVVSHYRYLAGFGVMLIDTPSQHNRITLDSAGKPEIRYEISAGDRQRLRSAIAEGVRIMFKAGARRVLVPSHEDIYGESTRAFEFTSPNQVSRLASRLEFVPNATLVTSAHLQASNKMGTQEVGSVVGTDFHVWGVTGLYVMDSSVFPSSVGANPMQSIYVMAKLFADDLTRQSGSRPSDH